MRIHRVGESIELSQIDATGEQLLASITGGVESGHRIFEGDRVGLAIARGRGSWCCDLAIDLDDSAMALTRISRILRLGLVTVRLAKRHLQIATKKERVVFALVDGRINVRLIWTETTGLQVWAGGTCQGHLAHTGFVPSTAYIGEPTSDRSWSGLLRHFSIRQGENHEEWNPDDVVAAPDDLALITGLWNEELMDQLKNDVLAQTGLLRH